jgi:WD40 repeat protein
LDVGEKADALAFSCDGSRLAIGSARGIRFWDVQIGRELGTPWRAKGTRVLRFSPLSPAKQTLVAAQSAGLVVRDGTTEWERMPFGGDTLGPVHAVGLSRDGRLLAAAAGKDPNHQAIRVWQMADGRDAGGPSPYTGCVTALDFSPDSKLLAAATNDGAKLWEVAGWKPARDLFTGNPAKAVVFSPDGRTLAVGGRAGACIWDERSWSGRSPAPGSVTCLAFSPDGKILALGRSDGTVQCWDVAAWKESRILPAQAGAVTALAFLPKSRIIAVGGAAKTVRLFDLSKPVRPPGIAGTALPH